MRCETSGDADTSGESLGHCHRTIPFSDFLIRMNFPGSGKQSSCHIITTLDTQAHHLSSSLTLFIPSSLPRHSCVQRDRSPPALPDYRRSKATCELGPVPDPPARAAGHCSPWQRLEQQTAPPAAPRRHSPQPRHIRRRVTFGDASVTYALMAATLDTEATRNLNGHEKAQ